MEPIKHSLAKVMYFPPLGRCKSYDIFSFCTGTIFARIRSGGSGTMDIIKVKKFVTVVSQWMTEAGADCTAKRVY